MSWDKTAVNNCISGYSANFQTQLDWADFYSPTDGIHNPNLMPGGLWTRSTSLGFDVSLGTSGTGLARGDNYQSVYTGSTWVDWGAVAGPVAVSSRFASAPDAPYGLTPYTYGDHLMGVSTNQANSTMTIVLGKDFEQVGLRVAAKTQSSYTFNMYAYDVNGSLLGFNTFNLVNGGTCATLSVYVSNPPSACNDAPFIGFQAGLPKIHTIVLSTNDTTGFWADSLFLGSPVPEPSTILLSACGVALLAAFRKKLRRA